MTVLPAIALLLPTCVRELRHRAGVVPKGREQSIKVSLANITANLANLHFTRRHIKTAETVFKGCLEKLLIFSPDVKFLPPADV